MGCIAHYPESLKAHINRGGQLSEYEEMIRFGRPLFAAMYNEGKLQDESIYTAAEKIILGKSGLPPESRLSVLGTRIQMGQTCAAVVSDLVSKGYAHLTSFQQAPGGENNRTPTRATFAFLPDPVCARICMALMDEHFKFEGGRGTAKCLEIRGREQKFWSQAMGDLFSNGLCEANQGDFGEVASALFMLFCGDRLRKEADREYRTFSVGLKKWLLDLSRCHEETSMTDDSIEGVVNFIQVFRHTLRLPLKIFGSPAFLEGLFCKACAMYCPNNMEGVDIIVPCKISKEDYIPVFVSVKNYTTMNPGDANAFISQSLRTLHSEGVTRGLLLLCVVGQDRLDINKSDYKNVLGKNETNALNVLDSNLLQDHLSSSIGDMKEKIVPKMFCIHKDEFGIHDALISSKSQKVTQEADVFGLHHQLLHEKSVNRWVESKGEEKIKRILPSNYRKDARDLFEQTLCCVQDDTQPE